jgi:succinate dehydrogenase flavin-adding protein (antitoxin of CptAB toxin-antitoxin module)
MNMIGLTKIFSNPTARIFLKELPICLSIKDFSKNLSSNDDKQNIDIIEVNQRDYFTNVVKSYENMKNSRLNETLEEKRSRLLYQSRKRGTLENGLLLSNFSSRFLSTMDEKQLNDYDNIINNLHNEWDLYYWITKAQPIPTELKSNEIFKLLIKFCENELKENRSFQPSIN